MESPNNRATSVQLEIANIHDYLKGIVDLTEYHQRKTFCQTLNANMGCQAIHTELSGIFSQTVTASQALNLPRNSQEDVTSHVAVTSQVTWQRRTSSPAESMSSIDSAYLSSPPSPRVGHRHLDNVCDGLNEGFENLSSRSESPVSTMKHNTDFTKTEPRPASRKSGTKRAAASTVDESNPKPKKRRNRGPKPRIMYEGSGPMQLWQLILRLLVSPPSSELESGLVEWTREQKYGFRILQPHKLAELWGKVKKKPAMNFEKLARGLRYYYGKSMLEKVPGRENTYQFVWDISEILGYDPMEGIPAVAPLKNVSPVFGQSSGVTVSAPIDAVERITVPDDVLPDSLLDNDFSVSANDALPDCVLKNDIPVGPVSFFQSMCGMPPSVPTYSTPVANPWCGLPVPDTLFEMPISDPLCGIPVPDSVYVPVSNTASGFPVDFPTHQVVPIAQSDLTLFPESDIKCSFYEAL